MNCETSIIVPNYNNGKYLQACIESILIQDYKNYEIIVIDDNSQDESLKILENYKLNPKLKVLKLNKNKGPSFCRNIGIRISKGKYIAFLDSDDYWEPNKLSTQINYIKKNSYDFTYTDYYSFKEINNKKKILKETNVRKKFDLKSFLIDTSIGTSTIIISKNCISTIRFKKTPIMEDYLFKCNLLRKGYYAFKASDKKLTAYRISQESRNSNVLKNIFTLWQINKNYNKLNFIKNFYSILMVSFRSIMKYGLK